MSEWTKSLPERRSHGPWKDDYAASALESIAIAMAYGAVPSQCLDSIRDAAVEVRAWRKSLPKDERGERVLAGFSDARKALRAAAEYTLLADGAPDTGHDTGRVLRWVEAYLREAARLIEAGS